MKQTVDAIYEDGLLRPVEPLDLPDHERVCITVESHAIESWVDLEAMDLARQEGDDSIGLDEVRRRLSSLKGSLAELVIKERGEY